MTFTSRLAIAATTASLLLTTPVLAQNAGYLDRSAEDEIIYLVMPDRFANGDTSNDHGGIAGGRLQDGFDPADKGFYHGGDLSGLIDRLDYIQGLGVTAIWLTPVLQNRAVQGDGDDMSAGYHGYWGTDFTRIDPHLGDFETYKAFVDAAHARGMKVYFDIVVNHTADIIQYRGCAGRCAYRGTGDYPYQRRGGVAGDAINPDFRTWGFAGLIDPTWAYSPYVPAGLETVKVPTWLNDTTLYHNRGDSRFLDESSLLGDFVGLDDVMTEHPRVVAGFIALYGDWIDRTRIDGFRIDTVKHVDPAFWRAFLPAMHARAEAAGIPNFHIFGEMMAFDTGQLAAYTHLNGFDSLNDFPLQKAIADVVARGRSAQAVIDVLAADPAYAGGERTAGRLVTLTGNHDVLRLGRILRSERPQAGEDELTARMILAHAIILTSRGIPALYYGDEQGFTGEGDGDRASREDMFPSQVASYNDNILIGTTATTAQDNFDPAHPLYRAFAELTAMRRTDPALRRGRQVVRPADDHPTILAYSRLLDGEPETLIVLNTGLDPIQMNVAVEPGSTRWTAQHGECADTSSAPRSYGVSVPALGFIVCKAEPAKAH